MKKSIFLLAASVIITAATQAKPVALTTAEFVAQNFYTQTYRTPITSLTVAYTEKDASGLEVYYAFNVNNGDGFVIISAEDAGRPVIGYSNKGQYTIPVKGSNHDHWMQKRKKEIISIRNNNLTATTSITNEWKAYLTNTPIARNIKPHKATGITFPSSTQYLVQSTWDQSPNYNALCPGGSVTGCVATAMSQIMRYWNYPPIGIGSHSYCDCSASGFSENYGTLSANFGTTTYNWTGMPLKLTGPNTSVATLMYDAGVSVNMDYAPSGSGAWVISADDSICAQNSYVKYFGYNPATINGFYDSTMSPTLLIDTLENEMNSGRPVEYAGWDSTQGGHTWVCDGYDASDNFHMNWGWSGQDDGWYVLTNLNPAPYKFTEDDESLIGIEPKPVYVFANFAASPTFGCSNLTTTYTDKSITNGTITAWNWSFPGGTPATSTSQNPTITYSTSGIYNVTEVVTSSSGTDSITQVAYITVDSAAALPLVQGFESAGFPPVGWVIHNPSNHAATWTIYHGVGGYGKSSNCMYYNNCIDGVVGEYDQVYTNPVSYTGDVAPFLYFDVAYEPYGIQSGVDYSDTLAIYYSTDCGATWNNVYLKGGATLSTTGGGTAEGGTDTAGGGGCFVPTSKTWRTDTVSMPGIANQSSVMFSFENRSGYGSNIYIDNINLPNGALAVANIANPVSKVTLYPNPNNGQFTIDMQNVQGKQQLMVYNVLGQQIYSKTLDESKTQISIEQPAGVYFYRVLSLSGKTLSEGKLIIK